MTLLATLLSGEDDGLARSRNIHTEVMRSEPKQVKTLHARKSGPGDIGPIADLSRCVQTRLSSSGSLQVIGPLPPKKVAAYVRSGNAWGLYDQSTLVGSAFVEPVMEASADLRHQIALWGFDLATGPIWFLSKLMVEPGLQGQGLGRVLLGAIKRQIAAKCGSKSQHGVIVLDCWAGNDKLRAFYEENGFCVHGVFGEDGYEIAVFVWRF